ncbi:sulfatase [Pontiella sulfatireligans]|uniref:Arylsulfatase n=1 Tax=Pontiella sulfatireligans TaxID=2750658 RepID=A0A6C2UKR5_9BACT|nr:sulfatase [Pontiella sulfatireligans]SPS74449.1 sulfatase S1_7 [Kiritimatiellales bacterium]VGO20830.1 Arylsulfatase [Pontiella sulfatireligans]
MKYVTKATVLLLALLNLTAVANKQNSVAMTGNTGSDKPNILFIAVDDLRPELGCYGSDYIKSPNLDKLASEGMRFERAYCQQAICGPSRASLMTGCRPETIGVIENSAYFRTLNPDLITLSQHFINHGYESVYCGKIFHGNLKDEELSWSRKPAVSRAGVTLPQFPGGYAVPENQAIFLQNRKAMLAKYGKEGSVGLIHGPAYEAGEVEDDEYKDGYNTQVAIATLKDHLEKNPDKPLFMGLGFYKPHLNFIAPKRYWDLYNPAEIELTSQTHPPKDGAAVGLHESFELRVRHGIPKSGTIPDDLARTLLHGYYACVSYIDAQIGLMIEALEDAGIRDNTIIVVWGDHGWHLGEMGVWGKATNYEIGTRVPLIVWTPEMKSRGEEADSIVELIDLYPTLCDLAGLPIPEHCEGESFRPVLDDPEFKGKNMAISQFPSPALREWAANPLSVGMRQTFFGPLIEQVEGRIKTQVGDAWDRNLFENYLMGYALRTDRYRLVLWLDRRDPQGASYGTELYDLGQDLSETVNLAGKPEYAEVVKELSSRLFQQLKIGGRK